jgi:hypothetical protein
MSDQIPEVTGADEVEEQDQADALSTDTLDPDENDETWEPDQHLSNATAEIILDGDRGEETLDERLAQEEPDVDATRGGGADSDAEYRQV